MTTRKLYFVIGNRRRWQKFIKDIPGYNRLATSTLYTANAEYHWAIPHSNYDMYRGYHIDGIYVLQDGAEELIHMLTPALLVKDGFIMRIVD
jgi:hypothetical protein